MWIIGLLATLGCVQGVKIGVGIADMTGPVVEVAFMGYAQPNQKGEGLHTRQFSRSFIIKTGNSSFLFTSAECGMIGTAMKKEILKRLNGVYGKTYNEQNFMLSGTHTHSTPGGFLLHFLFDLNTLGFVHQTFNAYVDGIVRSIKRAHKSLSEGKIYLTKGQALESSVNRSPTAYSLNPEAEKNMYQDNVDRNFTQLKFVWKDGAPAGALTWFAVHPTSMNNTNTLVSSDNLGYASIAFEKKVNPKGSLLGKGSFVAAFASSNAGDVSPNLMGPKCFPSGKPCNTLLSKCENPDDVCIANGPGKDMFESTRIIGERIFKNAYEAWQSEGRELRGTLKTVHEYVDMPSQRFEHTNPFSGKKSIVQGCDPAMGYSFAAGTTDGIGSISFHQSTKSTNRWWDMIMALIVSPNPSQVECHAPKPILLSTGDMNYPYSWQPRVVSTALALLDNVSIACVPGELTTMAGRRLRRTLACKLNIHEDDVIIAGLCNTYSDYITTPEEYQAQRYEGASTIYGPDTLTIYLKQYEKLAENILKGKRLSRGLEPKEVTNPIAFTPPVVFDYAGWGRKFGDVIHNPEAIVYPGDRVRAVFVSGNPRNNPLQESSFLEVQRRTGPNWVTIATDADWETKLHWRRTSLILATSEAEVLWEVPLDITPGTYRVRHRGYFKFVYDRTEEYEGATRPFTVVKERAYR